MKETVSQPLGGNSTAIVVAACGTGYLPVGGGCAADSADAINWPDRRPTADGLGYSCLAQNTTAATVNVSTATMCCRKPGR